MEAISLSIRSLTHQESNMQVTQIVAKIKSADKAVEKDLLQALVLKLEKLPVNMRLHSETDRQNCHTVSVVKDGEVRTESVAYGTLGDEWVIGYFAQVETTEPFQEIRTHIERLKSEMTQGEVAELEEALELNS